MTTNPLITIIVPIYNSEKYLDKCIASIVNQTYKNLEIILLDDGSSDSTPEICDKWANNDSRIVCVHKENEGDVATRNRGIRMANGEYIAIIDNDDYMENDMIEFLYNLIVEYDADISRCGFWFEYEGTEKHTNASEDYTVKLLDFNEKIRDLLLSGHLSGVIWNKLYKAELIKKYQLEKIDGSADDILFNYRIVLDNPKMVCCDIPKHHYLIRENSMTTAKFGYGAFDIIRAKNIMLEKFKDNEDLYPYVEKSYVISAFIVLTGCLRNNACMDRYDEIRHSILAHKKAIFSSGMFSTSYKLKTVVLATFPALYNFIIKTEQRIRRGLS